MGMPAREKQRWTGREVRELIAAAPLATPRYELVDGELLVTPSPAPPHQFAVRELLVSLHLYLQEQPVAAVLSSPSDIEVEPEQVTQPDLFVISKAESERLLREGFPGYELLLAIEIVSPSSARHDRVKKRALYQRRVSEYWIVDLDSRVVERWRQTEERPDVISDVLEWTPAGATSTLRLDLPSFFARVWGE